jgi:hypothetical protein
VTILTAPFSSRNEIPKHLAGTGMGRTAVEVGTHRAHFAGIVMENWPGRLWCVDPWSVPPGYEYQATFLPLVGGTGDREDDYREAQSVLSKYGGRVELLRETSAQAVQRFHNNSLDFVYLDGDHSYEAVRDDLAAWWPKVRPGGFLAGHDFICPGTENGGWGRNIQPAVLQFSGLRGLDVYLIVEEGNLPMSFYMVKK